MYSIFNIYQANDLVLSRYHDINTEFSDETKLRIILNSPTTPLLVFEKYCKHPEQFTITTYKTNIHNALEASQIVQEENQLIGTDKPSIKPKKKQSKPRTKKAQQSKTEG